MFGFARCPSCNPAKENLYVSQGSMDLYGWVIAQMINNKLAEYLGRYYKPRIDPRGSP